MKRLTLILLAAFALLACATRWLSPPTRTAGATWRSASTRRATRYG